MSHRAAAVALISAPLVLGYLLDSAVGDPRGWPHPIRGVGRLISGLEILLNRGGRSRRRWAGALTALGAVFFAAAAAWSLQTLAFAWHPWLGTAVTAIGMGLLLARKALADEAGTAVFTPLHQGDIDRARRAVGMVVGRDTANLDAAGVARAAIETIAENATDGVIAPLLFALVGGLPALAAYKAINTLDSMIGYRTDRYRDFGSFAARLDDWANWIPARVAFAALFAAAALKGNRLPKWRVGPRPAGASPNAGLTEAAMAEALGVRLGGPNDYGGVRRCGAVYNPAARPPAAADIPRAAQLMNLAAHLVLATGIAIRWFVF